MVKGLKSLQDKLLRRIPKHVRAEVSKEMAARADKIVATMKSYVPRDSGLLATSIGWTWGKPPKGTMTIGKMKPGKKGGLRITFYAGGPTTTGKIRKDDRSALKKLYHRATFQGIPDYDYALAQEYGTKDHAPSPFFYPSWRLHKRAAKAGITRAMKRGIAKGYK